ARRADALSIDGALTAGAATSELVASVARAGPFGAGNPEPMLALPSHTIAYAEEVAQAHVRLRLRAGHGALLNATAFRAVGQTLRTAIMPSRGLKVHAAGCLAVDRWQGEERVQLRLTDLARDDLPI